MNADFHFSQETKIPSPALIYYRDIILENTKKAVETASSPDRLWPHVKSHKSRDILLMQLSQGITRFKCATLEEAEMTAGTDATHILLAYPLTGPNIGRFISLVQAHPDKTFFALGDSLPALTALSRGCEAAGMTANVLVDIDPGLHRTGILPREAPAFIQSLAPLSGIRFRGLHCYDGNRHEKEYATRAAAVSQTISEIRALCRQLLSENPDCSVLIMGGSPSFPCYASDMPEAFLSPGTVFLYDAGYTAQFPDLPYRPGAAVLTRVVSTPGPDCFTIDAGYKSISAEQKVIGLIPELPHAVPLFQSEEHWTFRMEEGFQSKRPPVGTVLYVIPWHICPTNALYSRAYVVSGGRLCDTWRITARR